jgi:hypothetical protein
VAAPAACGTASRATTVTAEAATAMIGLVRNVRSPCAVEASIGIARRSVPALERDDYVS